MKIKDCKECGFKHQELLPTQEELDTYYKEKYDKISWHPCLNLEESAYVYFNSREIFNIVNNNIHNTLPNTILDIGCGDGSLIEVFKHNKWEVKGIEPNKNINFKKDLDIFLGTFEEYLNEPSIRKMYSVVSLVGVLEHCRSPIEMLKQIKKIILPKGGLFIEVPNDFNPLQEIVHKGRKENYWIAKEHINYFNIKTLTSLLERCKFKIKYMTVSFPMELGILLGFDYLDDEHAGKTFHNLRFNMEKELYSTKEGREFKEKLYESFKNIGIGRTILCYAEVE